MKGRRSVFSRLFVAALVLVSYGTWAASPPQISGTPSTKATVGVPYSFTPTASDRDRNTVLKFSVVGKPVWASFNANTGMLSGTPQSSHVGVYSGITISVTDGRFKSSLSPFAITVIQPNRAPIANADVASTAFETPVTVNVLANDTDADGDILTVTGFGQGAQGNVVAVSGGLRYTPNPAFSGSDSFTYTAADGRGGSAAATVSVTVAARPNRAPVANDDVASTAFETPVTINVLENDTDADGDVLTISNFGQAAHGNVVAVSGGLRYTPNAAFSGSDSFTYTAADGHGGSGAATVRVIATAAARKANYGHYFATRYADKPADAAMLCEQAGVTGVVWRRTWNEVEPSAGVYDFSSYDQVLQTIAASHNPNCQLWIFIEYKSFSNSPIRNPCPLYLQAQHSGLNADGNQAATCFIWEPEVVRAYTAMIKAAAAKFDANPRIEGLIFQESALGFNGAYSQDVAAGGTYTAEAWRDGLIELISQCGAAFKGSRCMSYVNFIRNGQQYIQNVSAALAAIPNNRGCLSGPDLLPDSTALYSTNSGIYEVLARHDGCRSNSAQQESYEVDKCGLDCIFQFAVRGTFGDFDQNYPRTSGLCVNSYLFWNHRVTVSTTGLDWISALPVIAAYPYGRAWLDQCVGGGGPP